MRGKRICFILLVLLNMFCLICCSKKEDIHLPDKVTNVTAAALGQDISFSETGHFYQEDIKVGINSNKSCKIYYSMDGTDPDKNQILYTEPIRLIANKDTKAYVIKAKAYYDDGSESEPIIHTYFVGENVNQRFNTLVFSVTTDPYHLYDYEHGIFVEGKLRDEYIRSHPKEIINPDAPANYNIRGKEGEREVYLEVFEPDGNKVIGQKAGIRTYGGWSRAREQKSIKIIARKEYDSENNRLRYEFFPNRTSADGEIINSYKELVIRNCGNDNGYAFIRDELFQTLAGQAGFKDYEAVRPVAMFVNGEYRGFFWMHEVYCDQYFKEHYGKYDGSFEIIEGGETFKNLNNDGDNRKIINEYQKLYESYSKKDLTNDVNFNKLSKLIDVENYLSYYALNIYLGNEDWPHNNYKAYRYYAAEGERYDKAPFDGKWRYLLHDMDYSTGIYGTNAYTDNISNFIGAKGEVRDTCPLFGQLMQRKDCKEIFIKKTLDFINGAFAAKNLSKVLDEMSASRMNELKYTYGKGLLEDWVTPEQLPGQIQELKNYASQREEHILTKYQEYFNMGNIFELIVKPVNGYNIKINSYTTNAQFTGKYYDNYNTIISADIPEGIRMDYWLVNGKRVQGKTLMVTKEMIKNGIVNVELMIK